jgi:hypothetical protein
VICIDEKISLLLSELSLGIAVDGRSSESRGSCFGRPFFRWKYFSLDASPSTDNVELLARCAISGRNESLVDNIELSAGIALNSSAKRARTMTVSVLNVNANTHSLNNDTKDALEVYDHKPYYNGAAVEGLSLRICPDEALCRFVKCLVM